MTGLKLDHLCKAYDNVQALNDIVLDIPEKAFIVLAGPSGCGKTTLLHLIAGFLKCDKGEIYLNNKRIDLLEPDKRGIAMVFQDSALFPHLSVFDNIALGLSFVGVKDEEIIKRVNEMSKLVGIDNLLERKASTLSNGQKQRVSIARAFVRKPSLIIMDEPLSALDSRLKSQLRIEISMLYHKMDATFLYVTHDQIEAMTMADVLIIMKDGEIQQIGKPMEVYQNPMNLFTASFLGNFEMNILDAKIKKQCLTFENYSFQLHTTLQDQDIILAFRAEHFIIDEMSNDKGTIVLVEQLGDSVFYHVQWNKHLLFMKGNVFENYQVKDSIGFKMNISKALLFNKKTEERIYI